MIMALCLSKMMNMRPRFRISNRYQRPYRKDFFSYIDDNPMCSSPKSTNDVMSFEHVRQVRLWKFPSGHDLFASAQGENSDTIIFNVVYTSSMLKSFSFDKKNLHSLFLTKAQRFQKKQNRENRIFKTLILRTGTIKKKRLEPKPKPLELPFFVYSKSEYTLESVSVSGRLHDNSSQLHSIELKFCAQNCLINI